MAPHPARAGIGGARAARKTQHRAPLTHTPLTDRLRLDSRDRVTVHPLRRGAAG